MRGLSKRNGVDTLIVGRGRAVMGNSGISVLGGRVRAFGSVRAGGGGGSSSSGVAHALVSATCQGDSCEGNDAMLSESHIGINITELGIYMNNKNG